MISSFASNSVFILITLRGLVSILKRIAVAQLGGPTAVINATLEGIYHEALKKGFQVLGGRNGMEGLASGSFFLLDQSITGIQYIPGAFLGSGRFPATSVAIDSAINHLRKAGVDGLLLIGGNGTMWACHQFQQEINRRGYDIPVIGVPKTVDNDIFLTDHTPGFASAANFVSHAVQDIGTDLKSMRNFEHVRIIETMGRNVGWVTAASALEKTSDDQPPHLIAVPERPLDLDDFLASIQEIYKQVGYVIAVVSEGISSTCGRIKGGVDLGQGGPIIPGGVAEQISTYVRQQLGLRARSQSLGILQRSCRIAVSEVDRMEAFEVGRQAVRYLGQGVDGRMVSILRQTGLPYRVTFDTVPLTEVAGKERPLSEAYIGDDYRINASFNEWLRPLVGKGSISDRSFFLSMNDRK